MSPALGRRLLASHLLLLLAAAPVAAHGAPPERDFETRVLADQGEDCGGDGQTSVNGRCRGAHDLIALNTREAYDAGLGHVVIVTLAVDLGAPEGQALTDTVTFTANGATKTVVFRTTNDQTFTVDSAAKVVGPQPLRSVDGQPDGTRFTVDAWFTRTHFGLAQGDRLEAFSVTARRGETRGDIMPGGAFDVLGVERSGDTNTQRERPFVEIRGPVQYVRLTPEASVAVQEGETAFVNLQVRNLLNDMAQTVSYSADAPGDVETGFHVIGSSSTAYPATMDDAVNKGGTEDHHLAVTGVRVGSGTITVTLTTDRGGLVMGEVAYEVVPAGTATDGPGTGTPTDGEESPGLGIPVLAALLAVAAVRRR